MWGKGQPKMCVDVCTNGEGGGRKPALGFAHTSWKNPHVNINPFYSSVFFQYPWKP